MIGVLGLMALCEINFRFMRKREDSLEPRNPVPIFTEEEFEKRVRAGENLCILDNLVLNLT